ncbi:MAG: hypothetical protein LBU51_00810, partial [Bacteroidales bacterium]|nr:hypothetical protein [Bacteroidales bacterium]
PNPADTYCEFEWNFGDITGKKTLCITDLTGKQIHTRALQGAQGQWVWGIRVHYQPEHIFIQFPMAICL